MKIKRKGAYEYDLAWHQNASSLVVAKAAEACLVRGEDVETFIRNHPDMLDFMLRTKVPRSSKLVLNVNDVDHQLQNITRFYVTHDGGSLVKCMPPLAKNKPKHPMTDMQTGEIRWVSDQIEYDKAVSDCYYDNAIEKFKPAPDRRIGICVGWKVTECNDITDATVPINYDYYITEAKKLTDLNV